MGETFAKCLLTACLLAAGSAQAQGILTDPMRPANVVERAPASSESAPRAASPGMQVILTSPERRLAVIDGRVVALGGDRASSLSLHPGIEKKARPQP